MTHPPLEKILVVDSDSESVEFLTSLLQGAGYGVLAAQDGEGALRLFGAETPLAVLLDLGLGLSVLETIRRAFPVPVIVLSAPADYGSLSRALALGADDFLCKPCSVSEVLLRLRLRLGRPGAEKGIPTEIGQLSVDWDRAEVFRGNDLVVLSAQEFQLLRCLYHNRNQVLSRAWLLQHVWKNEQVGDDRLIDAAIKRLRAKIGYHLVETVRGVGFRLATRALV